MSAINAVVTALVSTFRAVAPTGLDVTDGQPADPAMNFLAVGWDEQQAGITFARQDADAAAVTVEESIAVACLIGLHSGQWADAAALRGQLLDVYTQMTAALRSSTSLAAVLMRPAIVTQGDIWLRNFGDVGADGSLTFTVQCQAMSAA